MIRGERVESARIGWPSYHDAVRVVAPVSRELFPVAKTGWTDVNAVARFADGICAFDSNRVGEIAATAVALDLKTRLGNGCSWVLY